jgi:hypothetical protein
MTIHAEEKTLEKIAQATRRERLLIAAFEGRSVEPGDQLAAIIDTARALRAAALPFALIGGIAVGIRSGVPRATNDVDIAVATSAARSEIASALDNAGFVMRGDFEHSLNYRHRNGEPVQIAFDPAFDEMIERAELLKIGNDEIPVVLTTDLIEMKQRASRAPGRRRSKALRDQADVELLREDLPEPDEGW